MDTNERQRVVICMHVHLENIYLSKVTLFVASIEKYKFPCTFWGL